MTDDALFPAEEPGVDPELFETAQLVQRVLRESGPRPAFRDRLRAELVAAHSHEIATGDTGAPVRERVEPGGRAGRRPGRRKLIAWVGAATAAVAASTVIAVSIIPDSHGPAPVAVAVTGDLAGAISVDPAASVRLRFSRPLDPDATRAALRIAPAADLQSTWDGDTLTVRPEHGFAPNVAYVLTIDRQVARTAGGATLAADLHVVFGTGSVETQRPPAGPPASLFRRFVAAADDGAEAPVTRDGALLVTSARASNATGQRSGLLRMGPDAVQLSASTDAICVSRDGSAVAYHAGPGIVFAGADGQAEATVPVDIDDGSPLGWIGDREVSFVGGGRLRAVDRAGTIRVLAPDTVDLARDGVDIAPGGRWVYLGHSDSGKIVDVQTGATHALSGITGDPSFSADGASVFWMDRAGRLATAASGGGPVRTVALPVSPGGVVSDLAVSPAGSRFVYSVTYPDGRAELRLAALPDGHTLAVDSDGAGASPNWAPSGQFFTVLASPAAGSRIQSVPVPPNLTDRPASFAAVAEAFADAQLSSDPDAEQALAGPGIALPGGPKATRATVLWVLPDPDGTASARIRLTTDATPQDPVTRQVEETVTLDGPADGPPVVRTVRIEPARPAPDGPQLTRLDADSRPDAVLLTFDSDLDPASTGAVTLSGPDGAPVPATASYDPASRTISLLRRTGPVGPATVVLGTGLRDVNGHRLTAELRVPVPAQ